MLTGSEIIKQRDLGRIVIDPFNESHVNPNSYDVTLSNILLVYRDDTLDVKCNNPTDRIEIPTDGYILIPNTFYLALTSEVVGSNYYVPLLGGKSSLARLGMSIHQTAGIGDLGFINRWTMEISVLKSLKIYPNMSIGQFLFYEVTGDTELNYSKIETSKYNDLTEIPVASKYYKNFKKGE